MPLTQPHATARNFFFFFCASQQTLKRSTDYLRFCAKHHGQHVQLAGRGHKSLNPLVRRRRNRCHKGRGKICISR